MVAIDKVEEARQYSEKKIILSRRLRLAALRQDITRIVYYLKRGADVNFADYNNHTILHKAAFEGSFDVVRALACSQELNLNPLTIYTNVTPLAEVLTSTYSREGVEREKCIKTIIALLDIGANPQPTGVPSSDCYKIMEDEVSKNPGLTKRLVQIFEQAKLKAEKKVKKPKARGIFTAVDLDSELASIEVSTENYPYCSSEEGVTLNQANKIIMQGDFKVNPGFAKTELLKFNTKLTLKSGSHIYAESFDCCGQLVLESGSELVVDILKFQPGVKAPVFQSGSVFKVKAFDASVPDEVKRSIEEHMKEVDNLCKLQQLDQVLLERRESTYLLPCGSESRLTPVHIVIEDINSRVSPGIRNRKSN